jgi:hypothetical protein
LFAVWLCGVGFLVSVAWARPIGLAGRFSLFACVNLMAFVLVLARFGSSSRFGYWTSVVLTFGVCVALVRENGISGSWFKKYHTEVLSRMRYDIHNNVPLNLFVERQCNFCMPGHEEAWLILQNQGSNPEIRIPAKVRYSSTPISIVPDDATYSDRPAILSGARRFRFDISPGTRIHAIRLQTEQAENTVAEPIRLEWSERHSTGSTVTHFNDIKPWLSPGREPVALWANDEVDHIWVVFARPESRTKIVQAELLTPLP